VGTGVIAWEYRRTDLKDRDKRAKEDAYRTRVEDEISDERRVRLIIAHTYVMSQSAETHFTRGLEHRPCKSRFADRALKLAQALMAETNQIRAVTAAIQQRQEQLQQQMDAIEQRLEAAPARNFKLL